MQTLLASSNLSVKPKEFRSSAAHDGATPGRGFLALTFGTLLSSQGAGAHRNRPAKGGRRATL